MPTAYVSEVSYAGTPATDFVEVAVTAGTDVSAWTLVFYGPTGTYAYTSTFSTPTTTVAGKDVYVISSGISAGNAVAIVDATGTALQFIAFYNPPITAPNGPLAGQTPSYIGVTSTSGQSIQTDDGGMTYYVQPSPNAGTIPCFAPGMMVDCPEGERPVETLKPGDHVRTRDHGPRPVIWTDRREAVFGREDFADRPIVIATRHMGASRHLIVSPQHRLLVSLGGDGSDAEVLVPAKSLLGLSGIRQMRGRKRMTWHHFALERHELVRVNGIWTESLLLGEMVLKGLPRGTRRHLAELCMPVAGSALNGRPVRPCLTVRRAREMLRRDVSAASQGWFPFA